MTPKEKCDELIKKYSAIEISHWNGEYAKVDYTHANVKEAAILALITVNEILNMKMIAYMSNNLGDLSEKEYWERVQEEIEKL